MYDIGLHSALQKLHNSQKALYSIYGYKSVYQIFRMKKIVANFVVICGVTVILHFLNRRVKGNFLLENDESPSTFAQPPLITKLHLSNIQSSEAPYERHFSTVHNKSASLPDKNPTDEKNTDAQVYNNGHRYICEILLNESGSDYNSDYLEDCVRLVDSHPRLNEVLIKTKQYIGWHKKRVEELSKSKRGISDERTLVATCPHSRCRGYGSQKMLRLGFAFVLAVARLNDYYSLSGQKVQLQDVRLDIFSPRTFDWSAFDNDSEVSTSKTTDLCSDVLSQSKKTVFYSISDWKTPRRMGCIRHLDYVTTDILNYASSTQIKSNFNDCLLFILIRMLFKFGEPVRKVERKFWELQGLNGNVEYAAVHIRTGVFDSGIKEGPYIQIGFLYHKR